MERKIGETFEYEGKKLQVMKSANSGCDGCFFEGRCSSLRKEVTGYCQFEYRTDNKEVIFVEITEEQSQEQPEHPQELNLCEILKDCPQGETFWSPMLDGVKFSCIDEERQMIIVETIEGHFTWGINADGTISIDEVTSPEIMIFPSRTQRDWTKVKYEPKKDRFDPKTLNAFEKILVRDSDNDSWCCDLFSHIEEEKMCYKYVASGFFHYRCCIPYNDETKHLVGTTEEAPEYYRYWED